MRLSNPAARTAMLDAQAATDAVRQEARAALLAVDPQAKTKDSDYVFIGFILDQLPHGVIGLLIAVMIAAALGSKAGELNALGTTTTIDLWRHFRPLAAHNEARNVRAAKWFTAFWGMVAIGFALFAGFSENLIEAINIIGSIFYGVVLGIFLVAFFLKHIGGTAVFWSAVISQSLIFALYFLRHRFPVLDFSYLWYNFIGCAACIGVEPRTSGDAAPSNRFAPPNHEQFSCHLLRPAALRVFSQTVFGRENSNDAAVAKGDRWRDCFLLS